MIVKKCYDDIKGMVLMFIYQLSIIVDVDDMIVNVVDLIFMLGIGFFCKMLVLVRVFIWLLIRLFGIIVNNVVWRYFDVVVVRGKESYGSFISDWEISLYVYCFFQLVIYSNLLIMFDYIDLINLCILRKVESIWIVFGIVCWRSLICQRCEWLGYFL